MHIDEAIEQLTAPFRAAERATGHAPYRILDPREARTELLECASQVGPVFLPLLDSQGTLFGVHVDPGTPLADAGIVRFDHDYDGLTVHGRGIARFPAILHLWDHENRRGSWDWLDALAAHLPGGKPVPAWLREPRNASLLQPVWSPRDPGEDDPYIEANHPFAGLWKPAQRAPEFAERRVERFLAAHPPDPHLLALRALTRAEAGNDVTREDLERFLGREYWYFHLDDQLDEYGTDGAMALWHSALQAARAGPAHRLPARAPRPRPTHVHHLRRGRAPRGGRELPRARRSRK